MRITEAEILEAVANAYHGTADEDARTVPELAADNGVSRDRVRRALQAMAAAGRLNVHKVCRRGLDGRHSIVSAYTVTPAKKRKG